MRAGLPKLLPILLLAVCMPAPAGAQAANAALPATPLLKIQEKDEDGGSHAVTEISDISSTLRIEIDRDALRSRVAEQTAERLPADLAARLSGLHAALERREQSLERLASALDQWEKVRASGASTPPQEMIRNLSEAASPLDEVRKNPALAPRIRPRIEQRLGGGPMSIAEQYALVYDAIAEELRSAQAELDSFARENGISVQMGAWIATAKESRPIHLPGFDEYPEGERFVIDRWDIALNEAEQKQLESLAAQAKELKDPSDLALALWKANGPALIEAAIADSATLTCAKELQGKAGALRDQVEEAQATLRAALESWKTQLESFQQELQTLRTRYGTGEGAAGKTASEFLLGTNQDLTALFERTSRLATTLRDLAKTLTGLAAGYSGAAKTGLTELLGDAQSCARTATDEAGSWKNSLLNQVAMLQAGRPLDLTAFEFGSEVKKLMLDEIPAEVTFPLETTGERAAGDSVVVKLALFEADGSGGGTEDALEHRRILLFRVLPHIERTVGLIFADPDGETQVTNRFQAAPGYSLLLKGTWDKGLRRSSVAYNRIVDFGFGLNIAALDFNKDDTPELGLGLVLSAFRDILQAGAGYDVNEDEPYWFFGVRVPMPTR